MYQDFKNLFSDIVEKFFYNTILKSHKIWLYLFYNQILCDF